MNQAVDDLMVQTQKLPAFLAKVESTLTQRRIVIDPLLEGASGQQTEVTRVAEQRIVQRMQAQFERLQADHGTLGGERLALGTRCLFIDYARPPAESLLTMEFVGNRLGCRATARNVRSLARIDAKM